MPPAGFEPAIPASERPQTHALDGAAPLSEHSIVRELKVGRFKGTRFWYQNIIKENHFRERGIAWGDKIKTDR
jgi:hypothetical protein